jgi:hypothetical protein
LEWSDFFIKRGRTLADFALGERGRATIEALKELRDTAEDVGFTPALPAIEAALREVETR